MECSICSCCDQKLYRDSSTNEIFCGEECQQVAYGLIEYVKPTHIKYAYEWTLGLLEKDRSSTVVDKWVKLFSTLEMQRRWKGLMMNYRNAIMSSQSMDGPIREIQRFMKTEFSLNDDITPLFTSHQTNIRAYYRLSKNDRAKRNALKYAEEIGKKLNVDLL
jgi:hypothetical protein